MNRGGESEESSLISDIRGKTFSLLQLLVISAVGFPCMTFIRLNSLLFLFCWKIFKINKDFFCLLKTFFCRTYNFLKIIYLFIFRERRREGERVGEKHQCVVASHVPQTGNLAHNPGMCPDWESNWCPFGFQAHAQSTAVHQPGLDWLLKSDIKYSIGNIVSNILITIYGDRLLLDLLEWSFWKLYKCLITILHIWN